MSKYIDADKLRAEIERRREANKRQYLSSNGGMSWQRMCGEEDCLVELLSFIDSLQEEKPIEKDMKLVFKKNPAIQVTAPKIKTIKTGNYGWYDVEDCTDGGYEKILAPFSMAFWDLVEK